MTMPPLPHPHNYSVGAGNAAAEAAFNARSEHACVHSALAAAMEVAMTQYRQNDSDEACDILNTLQTLIEMAERGAS
jgi:hypothetical protein